MNPLKLILPSAAALALASCASKNADPYDTNPYGPADGYTDSAPYQDITPSNQTYDTPAAYEDAGSSAASANIPAAPSTPAPAPTGHISTTHTVVRGDTLGGISKKYGVSMASIKAANNMTNDIVVLGRTLKIPAN